MVVEKKSNLLVSKYFIETLIQHYFIPKYKIRSSFNTLRDETGWLLHSGSPFFVLIFCVVRTFFGGVWDV